MNNIITRRTKVTFFMLIIFMVIISIMLVTIIPHQNQAAVYANQSKTALFLTDYRNQSYLTFQVIETPIYKPTIKPITLPTAIMMTKYAGTNEANYNQSWLQISETVIELTKSAK